MSVYIDARALEAGGRTLCLEMSPGVEPAADARYEPHACIALDRWQPIDCQEAERLGLRFGADAAHNTIALLTLPPSLVDELGRKATTESPDANATLADWLAMNTAWRIDPAGARGAGLCIGQSTHRSATRESRTGEFVGLHLDSWDCLPLDRRHDAQNRICVNLGRHPRALQFVPLPIAEVSRRLRAMETRIDGDPVSARPAIVERYLHRCQDQPVLRVRLAPGQAYIAPTENLVHDGCLLKDGQDVTYVYRGRLVPQVT